jgi:hypothetical protein
MTEIGIFELSIDARELLFQRLGPEMALYLRLVGNAAVRGKLVHHT